MIKPIEHFVFITNGFNDGKRYCLHLANTDEKVDKIKQAISYYSKNKRISTYTVITDSESWQSVINSDPFYEDLVVFDWNNDLDAKRKFEEKINGNKLNAFDIVLLFLSQEPLTFVEAILYLIYVSNEYTNKTGKRVFEEKILFDTKTKQLTILSLEGHFAENFKDCFETINNIGFLSYNKSAKRYNYDTNEILFSKIISSGTDLKIVMDILNLFKNAFNKYHFCSNKLFRMLFLEEPLLENKQFE